MARFIPIFARWSHKSRMKAFYNILHVVMRHKYLITLAVFAVIIGIVDDNNLLYRAQLSRKENSLRSEIKKYRSEYEENTRRLNELNADSTSIEHIAREKYLMKKPDEDIFVFEGDIDK